jgi:hypothetical protein
VVPIARDLTEATSFSNYHPHAMIADLGLLVSQPEHAGLDCVRDHSMRRLWGKASVEAEEDF